MIGYHFLRADMKLNRPPHTLVKVGQTLTATDKPLSLCHYGLHAAERAIDALEYAPGPIVCRVKLGGKIERGTDKVCAEKRTCLAMADASTVLHEFACWCAETALIREKERGREPDKRSWAAIETKRKWLRGEATDEELSAARATAWDTAWARAARNAAQDAAQDAARDAARDSARAAAQAACRGWATARDSAWATARDEQNKQLGLRLTLLLKTKKRKK